MIERLETILNRYNELSAELTKMEVINDVKLMTSLSKEASSLETVVNLYKKIQRSSKEFRRS